MQEKIIQRAAGAASQHTSTMESAFDVPQAAPPARSLKAPKDAFAPEDEASTPALTSLAPGGLPMQLKLGIEQLAGVSMEGVTVRYNSDVPAQYQALAFAEGDVIYLAPGQEKLLPHEAWHVAQQRLGKVKPTTRVAGKPVNTDPALEAEADTMGALAMQVAISSTSEAAPASPVRGEGVVQGFFGFEGDMLTFILSAIGILGFSAVAFIVSKCLGRGGSNSDVKEAVQQRINSLNSSTQGSTTENQNAPKKEETESKKEEKPEIKKDEKEVNKDQESNKDVVKILTETEEKSDSPKFTEKKTEKRVRRPGDCLYTSVNDALGNAGNNEDIFREIATNWLVENYGSSEISQYGSLEALIQVVSTRRAWAGNAGDLSPVVLAFALGIELHVVTPGGTYVFNSGGGNTVTIYHYDNHFTADPVEGVHDNSGGTIMVRPSSKKSSSKEDEKKEAISEAKETITSKEKEVIHEKKSKISKSDDDFTNEEIATLKNIESELSDLKKLNAKQQMLMRLISMARDGKKLKKLDLEILQNEIKKYASQHQPTIEKAEESEEETEQVEPPSGYVLHHSNTNNQDCYVADPDNLIKDDDLNLAIDHLVQGGNSHHRTAKVAKGGFDPEFEKNPNVFYLHIGHKGARLYLVTYMGNHKDGLPMFRIIRRGSMGKDNNHRF